MKTILGLLLVLLVISIALLPHSFVNAATSSAVKTTVVNAIDKQVKGDWSHLKLVIIRESGQARVTVYNTTIVPNPPPNPPPTPGVIPQLNKTKNVRVGVVGDVDNNAGLVTQLNLMKKYGVQYLILPGDFGYSSGQGVLDKLTAAGFTKSNTEIVLGNHDSCSLIKSWSGDDACFGDRFLNDKIAVFAIDGNSNFGCGTTQYNQIKSDIEGSDAWYNIPAVHQPFVTGPSHHSPNGQQECYQTLFSDNGIDLVLEAHNHNYQRFFIDPVTYWLVGTGTHDSGSNMYSISSNAQFNGKTCSKCFTGTNGIGILDLQINDPQIRHIDGYFLSNSEKVMDTFVINK